MLLTIVDNDPFCLNNLNMFLGGELNISVIGAYTNAMEALNALESRTPEIVLMDPNIPGMNGFEFIGKMKAKIPAVEVMVYSVHEDRNSIFSALKAGATSYILKGCQQHELVKALHNLAEGGTPMTPRIARIVIKELQDMSTCEQYLLTHREKDILRSIDNGMSYKRISTAIHLSVHTVHTHVTHIYKKLQAKNRREALQKALKLGII